MTASVASASERRSIIGSILEKLTKERGKHDGDSSEQHSATRVSDHLLV
jgi:hypothetical protein